MDVDIVDIDINERVGTVFELTRLAIVSILASASSCVAPTVAVAIFPAIIQGQQVNVFIGCDHPGVLWESWVFNVVKTVVMRPKPHVFPPSSANITYGKRWQVLNEPLLFSH